MRISQTVLVLLAFGIYCTQGLINNPLCTYKMFPVFAGGSRDEFLNTIEIDPTNNFILAGGKT
jgi:hypothetical protein